MLYIKSDYPDYNVLKDFDEVLKIAGVNLHLYGKKGGGAKAVEITRIYVTMQ